MKAIPRGIRNHNPGNIDWNAHNKWQGQAGKESGVPKPRFARFESPEWGIRAIAVLIVNYQDKHGIRSVQGVINRWAPPVENDTNAYAHAVAKSMGVSPTATLDLQEYRWLEPLVKAIIKHESGPGPLPGGQWYSQSMINKGLHLAGVQAPMKSLTKSKTMVGSVASGLGGAMTLAAENAPMLTAAGQQLSTTGVKVLETAAVVLIVGGALLAIYGRASLRKKTGV